MEKIGDMKKTKYYITDIFSVIIVSLFCLIWTFKFGNIKREYINLAFFTLPIIVIITLTIHELIHILFFKLFGKKKAKIKVLRDKDLKAIVIYQHNKDVFYSKLQTITVLLMPLILITMVSIVLLFFIPNSLIIKFNMILNVFGSVIDMAITVRLLIYAPKGIKINYTYEKECGVILNYYK